MATWGDLLTQVRRSVLQDTSATPTYSDDVLLDTYTWAMHALCEHTALPKSVAFDPAQASNTLPDDVYDPVDSSGVVTLTDADGNISVLEPMAYASGPYDEELGYYVWGNDLVLSVAPEDGSTLDVRYFAYYPEPALSSDTTFELLLPKWAVSAVAMLMGAYALSSTGVRGSKIEQFRQQPDKGNPSDNANREQADWMIRQYDKIISRHRRQDRETYFTRNSSR